MNIPQFSKCGGLIVPSVGGTVCIKVLINVLCLKEMLFRTTAESSSSQRCTIRAYSVMISHRLANAAHRTCTRITRDDLCERHSYTTYLGRRFFLPLYPCFHSCASSRQFQWLFLSQLHIVQLFYILYILYPQIKNYILTSPLRCQVGLHIIGRSCVQIFICASRIFT